jgi:hypothetical protein
MNIYRQDCRVYGVKIQGDCVSRATGFRLSVEVCNNMRAV